MLVTIRKSPKSDKKYRAQYYDKNQKKKNVDFGGAGYSDYTIHKDPFRMRRYVKRHGGEVQGRILKSESKKFVQNKMLTVDTSTKETWGIKGLGKAGFWSRWLLWSFPSLKGAARFMEKKFDIKIVLKV